jgi:P pilus assembly chaperone PapD
MVTIAAGETRNIRVGTLVKPLAVERSYRLFVEHLPSSEAERTTSGLRVLTRAGIPVFVEPTTVVCRAQLRDLAVAGGTLSFTVANAGTVHFVPDALTVRGVTVTGAVAFERSVPAWYVLAGGIRSFRVQLNDAELDRAAELAVQLDAADVRLVERVAGRSGGLRSPRSRP